MKRLLLFIITSAILVGCDLIGLDFTNSGSEDKENPNSIKVISNIPNSNWESIIVTSPKDALCINYTDAKNKEMMAVIEKDFEIRLTFDESNRPLSLISEEAIFHIEYLENTFNIIYTINDISGIESFPTKCMTKASGEEAFDFALDITKSEITGKVIEKADKIIEEKYGKQDLLGNLDKFIDMVNTLRELDGIDKALELVDYLESTNDIIKFIDLIKTKPNHKQDNSTTYTIGIVAGKAEVNGSTASLELRGTIKGQSKGKEFDFEYGVCYSSSSNLPVYSNGKVGTKYSGLMVNPINVTLPRSFTTSSLNEGKYYYRGFFKDNETSNIIYSDNVGVFEIAEKERPTPGQWVDLGLPSGIKWAGWNVGANAPEEYGGFYAWGEIEEKSEYSFRTYKHREQGYPCNERPKYHQGDECSCWEYKYIGDCISGTSYDVATIRWGDGARMPTLEDFKELVSYCDWEFGKYRGIDGAFVIGPNNNSIFLGIQGIQGIDYYGESIEDEWDECFAFWLGTPDIVTSMWGTPKEWYNWRFWNDRYYGVPVRPVSD